MSSYMIRIVLNRLVFFTYLYNLITFIGNVKTFPTSLIECPLGPDLLNSLVNDRNKDLEEYGVENSFGLIGDHPGEIPENEALTSKELQDCLKLYNRIGPPNFKNLTVFSLNLHYNQLPHFGKPEYAGVPVPNDEDYLPDEYGYTTYINPHNFKEKGFYNYGGKKRRTGKEKGNSKEDLDGLYEPWLSLLSVMR